MMSRSWVARSIATPASLDARAAAARRGWRGRGRRGRCGPRRSAPRACATAGLKRSTWPTISLRPAARAAAAMRSASGQRGGDRLLDEHVHARARAPRARPRRACSDGQAIADGVDVAALEQVAPVARAVDRPAADARARAASSSGSATATSCARLELLPRLDVEGAHPARRRRRRSLSSLRHAASSRSRVGQLADDELGDPLAPRGRRRRSAGARPGAARAARPRSASGSTPTSVFQPVSTVSTHSVSSRSVTHGTPHR